METAYRAMANLKTIFALTLLSSIASAQSICPSSPTPAYSASLASGYRLALVATGLARPRGIQFDSAGNLLVVEAPRSGTSAITALSLEDGGGVCVRETSRKAVVEGQGVSRIPQRALAILTTSSVEPWNCSVV